MRQTIIRQRPDARFPIAETLGVIAGIILMVALGDVVIVLALALAVAAIAAASWIRRMARRRALSSLDFRVPPADREPRAEKGVGARAVASLQRSLGTVSPQPTRLVGQGQVHGVYTRLLGQLIQEAFQMRLVGVPVLHRLGRLLQFREDGLELLRGFAVVVR
jgi:hypothetical protein